VRPAIEEAPGARALIKRAEVLGKTMSELDQSSSYAALPVAMNETLGPRIADLRPRWAIGTSRLVARLLAKHIDEFTERDMSLVLGR
jgi:hypothetical protein